MATYSELNTLAGSNSLIERITIAITISADKILKEPTPSASRLAWAKTAFIDPASQARSFQYAILAANNTATIAAIQSATDASIQSNVDAAVTVFAGA